MHLAKAHHDGIRTYDPAVDRHALNRLALLGDLRRALETDDQIVVHYQPKVVPRVVAAPRLRGCAHLVVSAVAAVR
ncbi:hypothetical protein Adu01nite_71250 [Paractinoplanes durhamensis]|uniref:Uncharacterized protein n=1 Tax=Paractinoplanes durhamensis TaxID=113563 RepID=A0ABQ3Z7I1_9ACTN|nr:hypothetical protein Adu01nite_71250 [Actinoplanes durhamensis]